jgi:hypothetical protein
MTHAVKTLSPVKGRRLRVTRLDGCGRPVLGDDSQVVTKGFVSVGFTANTTESEEINVTNAGGERCVFEASVQSLVGYALEIVFCKVDPELVNIVTGQPVVLGSDGTTVIGFDIDTQVTMEASNYALELWAGAPTGNACVVGAQGTFGYILLPYLSGGILGDFSVENAAVTFTVTGSSTKEGNAWGVGPYSDIMLDNSEPTALPGPMSSPVSTTTALRVIEVDLAPPEPVDGARPLMDSTLPNLTDIAAVEDVGDVTGMTADFTTTPAATGPVYYEFGDGTWDYVAAPGDTTHEYETAGTYTVRATQNNVWVETEVTVPFS